MLVELSAGYISGAPHHPAQWTPTVRKGGRSHRSVSTLLKGLVRKSLDYDRVPYRTIRSHRSHPCDSHSRCDFPVTSHVAGWFRREFLELMLMSHHYGSAEWVLESWRDCEYGCDRPEPH
jgi:hypothetical protein